MLKQWLEDHLLDYTLINDRTFTIEGFGKFLVIEPKFDNSIILDPDFKLVFSEEDESTFLEDETITHFAFQFGNNWYYCGGDGTVEVLETLRYLGKERLGFPEGEAPPFVGIHGPYDLCNGSRDYKDWCKKAKFCNVQTLGIAEDNTLAGTLAFQNTCEKNNIHAILGETITVKDKSNKTYNIKLYVLNDEGWRHLLRINAEINVVNESKFICEDVLFSLAGGLICVLTPQVDLDKKFTLFQKTFPYLYYQFDVSRWDSDEQDSKWLLSIEYYIQRYLSVLPPILINDAFYLEKADAKIHKDLNAIGGVHFQNQSSDQYFKTPNQSLEQTIDLFKDNDSNTIVLQAIDSLKIFDSVQFKIETGKLYLPKYIMSSSEQEQFTSNQELFWDLLGKGLEEKVFSDSKKDVDAYMDRLKEETDVILKANLHDYFLITWDILNFCSAQGITTGYGRGSAAGSLVAYLLNIVKVDPLEYDLLFSRFLNSGRLFKKKKVKGFLAIDPTNGVQFTSQEECEVEQYASSHDCSVEPGEIEIEITGSMPDIDNDVAGERREEVKRYLESKYGVDRVASIGTYGTFKVKGALQALARRMGVDMAMTRYVTGAIADDSMSFTQLFKHALQTPIVMSYIQDYPDLIEKLPLIFDQPFNASMHAAGVIIVPESEYGIFDQLPVKKVDGVIISEWEMGYVEQAGFLKMDLLGLKRLDKFSDILTLIKEFRNVDIDLVQVPLDDIKVYETFAKGQNEDVFQFGGHGLKGYTQDLKPENINDLIATVALYRPGPIETQAHMQYVDRKNGREMPQFPFGTENILQETYGNIVYQEQVIKIVQVVGGFTMNEADDVRKAMGKKDAVLMAQYKQKFVDGAMLNGAPMQEASNLWDQMEVFAQYAFNKCIAGTEQIYRASQNKVGKSTYWPTIEEMYKIRNHYAYAKSIGKLALYNKYRCLGYPHSFSLNEENRLVKNKIKDIRLVGSKDIYRVTVESGKTIDVTINHKFPTSNGEKKLEDIDTNVDLLFTNQGFIQYDSAYRFGQEGNNFPTKGQQGFQSKDSDYTQWKELVGEKPNQCELCDTSDVKIEMHHKDGNHGNNSPENVQYLCVSCHKKEEYKLGRKKMGEAGLHTNLEKIASIEFLRQGDVYDVEMEAPYHTFTTKSGIVTSNSHATCYAITGYHCQWLKVNYPLEFWTVSLRKSTDDQIPARLSEMYATSSITVAPPDINKSGYTYESDPKLNIIYWTITSIKQVGKAAIDAILEEREKNGPFYSVTEFAKRLKPYGAAVKKNTIINLIITGSFDEVASVSDATERFKILQEYHDFRGLPISDDLLPMKQWKEYKWILQQRALSGLGYIDFSKIIRQTILSPKYKNYITNRTLLDTEPEQLPSEAIVGGVIVGFNIKGGNYRPFALIDLSDGNTIISVVIWNNTYESYKALFKDAPVGKLCLVSGAVKYDNKYKKQNALNTVDNKSQIVIFQEN